MDDRDIRKRLLGSRKTERIIFAATPETKAALEAMAQERCVSVSALITGLVVDEAIRCSEVIEEVLGNE